MTLKGIPYRFAMAMISIMVALSAIAQSASTITHVMQKGETLQSIAARYSTTPQAIIELNPEAAEFTYVGMELKVPVNSAVVPSVNNEKTRVAGYMSQNTPQSYVEESPVESETEESWNFLGIGYIANFSNNGKGVYGLTAEFLPYNGGLGFYLFYGTGWGVSSDDLDVYARLGPTFGYRCEENIMFSCPVCLTGQTFSYLEEVKKDGSTSDGYAFALGIAFSPRFGFKIGKNACISLGLDLNYCFKTKKTTTIETDGLKLKMETEYGGTPFVGFTVSIGGI